MRQYAGIGSRETPEGVLQTMTMLAGRLADDGWRLSTGGADGADNAFLAGAGTDRATVHLPWSGYNGHNGAHTSLMTFKQRVKAEQVAIQYHPAWDRCRQGARKLHARNVAIIAGPDLDSMVTAVICWTPGGAVRGGTATGIRLAEALAVPVYNLAIVSADDVLEAMIRRAAS